MAKIFKINGYLVDPNGDCTSEDILTMFDNADLGFVELTRMEEREFKWDDSLPINRVGCPESEYEKYFRGENNG
jgi:hypothetical protein